jgi:hypothetical protein
MQITYITEDNAKIAAYFFSLHETLRLRLFVTFDQPGTFFTVEPEILCYAADSLRRQYF